MPNEAFGFWKVKKVERPLRWRGAHPERIYAKAELKALQESSARRDGNGSPDAPPVLRKRYPKGVAAEPLHGRFEATVAGKNAVVGYWPDPDFSDTERVPLQTPGGIKGFLRQEVLPYAADAWYDPGKVTIGYEINFNRYFYRPEPMRELETIREEIVTLESKTAGLLGDILGCRTAGGRPPRG